jgi:hypothetical protein
MYKQTKKSLSLALENTDSMHFPQSREESQAPSHHRDPNTIAKTPVVEDWAPLRLS